MCLLTYIVFSIYVNISSSLSLVTGFYRNRYITYTYNEEKKGERNPRQNKYITNYWIKAIHFRSLIVYISKGHTQM